MFFAIGPLWFVIGAFVFWRLCNLPSESNYPLPKNFAYTKPKTTPAAWATLIGIVLAPFVICLGVMSYDKISEIRKQSKERTFALRINQASEYWQLEYVKKDGMIIRYIQEQSSDVQLAAIKQNPLSIQYVQKPCKKLQLQLSKEHAEQ